MFVFVSAKSTVWEMGKTKREKKKNYRGKGKIVNLDA